MLTLVDLYDLRDRALLMINNQQKISENQDNFKTPVNNENLKSIYEVFINSIESLNNIIIDLNIIYENGFPIDKLYGDISLRINDQDNHEILEFEKIISVECNEWEKNLIELNKKHHILNFFCGKELIKVQELLKKKGQKLIEHLYFVNPNVSMININELPNYPILNKSTQIQELELMANYLEEVFKKIPAAINSKIPILNSNKDNLNLQNKSEKIILVKVESYTYYISGLLVFFREYDSHFPLANQVFFCTQSTSWQELRSFLFRLVFNPEKQFYALIGPERLNFENQDLFLKFYNNLLKEFQNHFVKLAIITKDPNCHIVNNVNDSTLIKIEKFQNHSGDILKEACSKDLISNWEKNVTTVISAYSGLGKTVHIKNSNKSRNTPLVKYPISNCEEFSTFAQQLEKTIGKIDKSKQNYEIYFDILHSNNDEVINEFLFIFIFLKVFKINDCVFTTENVKHFYIEIANTFNEQLRQRIYLASYFRTYFIEKFDISKFTMTGISFKIRKIN